MGFGIKAGFAPFHTWLPEAHPAAPSHVSAIMSGVMIKTGIYGILRVLTILGMPTKFIAYTVLITALLSAMYGVLYAISQHDIKRLLAYHSIENIGIIGIGIGAGLLGVVYSNPMLAVLGFSGGIFHILNHSLFKELLFLSAGSVYTKTHTRDVELLGGLIKKMPYTAVLFIIASVAICGLRIYKRIFNLWRNNNRIARSEYICIFNADCFISGTCTGRNNGCSMFYKGFGCNVLR